MLLWLTHRGSDMGRDESSGHLLDRQEISSKQYMQIHKVSLCHKEG